MESAYTREYILLSFYSRFLYKRGLVAEKQAWSRKMAVLNTAEHYKVRAKHQFKRWWRPKQNPNIAKNNLSDEKIVSVLIHLETL